MHLLTTHRERPPARHRQPAVRHAPTPLLAALLALALAGCAPDAWRPDSRYDSFLDQLQQQCGELRIGSRSIGSDLIENDDPYFIDVTSRYYHGRISAADYAQALAGSFGAEASSPGIVCLLSVQRTLDRLPQPANGI